jgi:putative nucleotidyltransferase with HDIG domain
VPLKAAYLARGARHGARGIDEAMPSTCEKVSLEVYGFSRVAKNRWAKATPIAESWTQICEWNETSRGNHFNGTFSGKPNGLEGPPRINFNTWDMRPAQGGIRPARACRCGCSARELKFVPECDDDTAMISAAKEPVKCVPLERAQIDNRLKGCACLPSLASIDSALKELLSADQRYSSQIAEIIRRDPSLTARLLRLVNSVYYGISTPVKNIEEAVFYLGVRQIRQLAVVTPIIEDLQKLAGNQRFDWSQFWRHCIGTALMTRDVVDIIQAPNEETDYVGGLIHDLGKIVMTSAFPEHFRQIYGPEGEGNGNLLERERAVLGVDHAELGAMYLKKQVLPEVFIDIVQYHHQPEKARENSTIVAAVQVADMLVRHAKIGSSGNATEVAEDAWMETPGWQILFGRQNADERVITRASLKRSLERIPVILEGLV